MPLLEDATSIQTAYMQIVHGVLSGHMQAWAARIALAAVKAAARNLPSLKAERTALSGEQSGLAQDVTENREEILFQCDLRDDSGHEGGAIHPCHRRANACARRCRACRQRRSGPGGADCGLAAAAQTTGFGDGKI
jgi:hypothetical protein